MRALGFLVLLGWIAACASPSGPAPDVGRFEGNVYENASLGFRVVLPTGWVFLKPEQLDAAVRDVIAKRGEQSELEKAALARTATLFGVVDLANAPASGGVPRTIAATLETLDATLVGMTSETYAAATRMTIETNPDSVAEFGKWHHQTVAGQDFVVLPAIIEVQGRRTHQDYFFRVENGRALGLVVGYPEGAASPQEALDAFERLPRAERETGVSP